MLVDPRTRKPVIKPYPLRQRLRKASVAPKAWNFLFAQSRGGVGRIGFEATCAALAVIFTGNLELEAV